MRKPSAKNKIELNPLWQLLRKTYGMETAFQSFGPYHGASIVPKMIDAHTVEVTMPLVPLNTNYVGTHFGGSLYSMCDPFFMFILMENLGPGYIVWDKSARIEFLKPGRGTVRAVFHVSAEEVEAIKGIIVENGKAVRNYTVTVEDENGAEVARVSKEIYIRRKA